MSSQPMLFFYIDSAFLQKTPLMLSRGLPQLQAPAWHFRQVKSEDQRVRRAMHHEIQACLMYGVVSFYISLAATHHVITLIVRDPGNLKRIHCYLGYN